MTPMSAADAIAQVAALPAPPVLTEEVRAAEEARWRAIGALIASVPQDMLPALVPLLATLISPVRHQLAPLLVRRLRPPTAGAALRAALDVSDGAVRADLIAHLAQRLPEGTLETAAAAVLAGLRDGQPGGLPAAMEVADALVALARRASDPALRLRLATQAGITAAVTPVLLGSWQVRALIRVSLLLPDDLAQELQDAVIDVALQGEETPAPESQARLLQVIAPRLRGATRRRLRGLVPTFPPALQPDLRAALGRRHD